MTDLPLLDLVQQCHRAHRARLAALLAPHGLHAGQEALLLVIWAHPGLRQAALAERLGVEPPTVSRMLERLERAGLVQRKRDANDGRLWRIHPTPRSRLLEASVRRGTEELEQQVRAALGESGGEQLRRLLLATTDALAVGEPAR
jgi:DNA-binding MarR family transcriptional regulator